MKSQRSQRVKIEELVAKVISGCLLDQSEALQLVEAPNIWEVLHGANRIRERYKGNTVGLCSIINAKSGNCAEDCAFCAQSVHHQADVKTYSLLDYPRIKSAYHQAQANGAEGFSIVTSGNELSNAEVDKLTQILKQLDSASAKTYLCGSLGKLSPASLVKLKQAGLAKCHHNLETSERFFPRVCSTHSYNERLQTIRSIKKAGLDVCSGGIFGMGEGWMDRIELAFALKELDVDSIPLNFLIPIKGTRLETIQCLAPLEILRIIALFRYILPDKNIRVCAGREKTLRDLQSWIFYAGANGMMVGGYLTQPGRGVADDLTMLKDLGLRFEQGAPEEVKDARRISCSQVVTERSS